MALQVWLPLDGNLENKGLSDNIFTSSSPTYDNNGKIGKCYLIDTLSQKIISNNKIRLGSQLTISFWIKVNSWVGWGRVFCL